MKALPQRHVFYAKLGNDQTELVSDMVTYFSALSVVVAQLIKFYREHGFDK